MTAQSLRPVDELLWSWPTVCKVATNDWAKSFAQSIHRQSRRPKATDCRSKGWDGGTCQLEALPPNIIADILREEIECRLDMVQYGVDQAREDNDRDEIQTLLLPPPQ